MKSKCKRLHCCAGHSHGWSGAAVGVGQDSWHMWHDFTVSAISASMPGHQMYARASDFILLMPGWYHGVRPERAAVLVEVLQLVMPIGCIH